MEDAKFIKNVISDGQMSEDTSAKLSLGNGTNIGGKGISLIQPHQYVIPNVNPERRNYKKLEIIIQKKIYYMIILMIAIYFVLLVIIIYSKLTEVPNHPITSDKKAIESLYHSLNQDELKSLSKCRNFKQTGTDIEPKSKIVFVTPDSLLFDCVYPNVIEYLSCKDKQDFRDSLLKSAVQDGYNDMIYNYVIGADGIIYNGREIDCPIGKTHEIDGLQNLSTLVVGVGYCFPSTPLSTKKTKNEYDAILDLMRYLSNDDYITPKFKIELPKYCEGSLLHEVLNNSLYHDINEENFNKSEIISAGNWSNLLTFYETKTTMDWTNYEKYNLADKVFFQSDYIELHQQYPHYFSFKGLLQRQDWNAKPSNSCSPRLPTNNVIRIVKISRKVNYNTAICSKNKKNCEGEMRDIQNYYLRKNFTDINLHYFIFKSGYVGEGRPLNCRAENDDEIIIGLDYPIILEQEGCKFNELNVVNVYRVISKVLKEVKDYSVIKICPNIMANDMMKLNLLLNMTFRMLYEVNDSKNSNCNDIEIIIVPDNST